MQQNLRYCNTVSLSHMCQNPSQSITGTALHESFGLHIAIMLLNAITAYIQANCFNLKSGSLYDTGQITKSLCSHPVKLDTSNSLLCKGIARVTTLAVVTYSDAALTEVFTKPDSEKYHGKPVSKPAIIPKRKPQYSLQSGIGYYRISSYVCHEARKTSQTVS